jgi:hypothetical protein
MASPASRRAYAPAPLGEWKLSPALAAAPELASRVVAYAGVTNLGSLIDLLV